MNALRGKLAFLVLGFSGLSVHAQSLESYRKLLTPQVRSDKLVPPQHLDDYVKDGKLSISLNDAVKLALENNSSVRI